MTEVIGSGVKKGQNNKLNSLSEQALKGLGKDELFGRSPVAEDR
jgi:hypothetical protein